MIFRLHFTGTIVSGQLAVPCFTGSNFVYVGGWVGRGAGVESCYLNVVAVQYCVNDIAPPPIPVRSDGTHFGRMKGHNGKLWINFVGKMLAQVHFNAMFNRP